ncbi:ECF RNA polymerase sigma factor SigE [Posidoniimonas polymericola]|uniref:ECF RNA polymerase sigma factor SigE n=1 Tax=Posidoniimonas polymericola TaxID=2528002 RepID=A0A5C5ZEP6_9BACT|nr:RNA polymerase sigma factor [Posidoniimonas polymericola]TWT85628.1 ECF RNA polymerase sigma factor SigE [Posidoniimonas polymericola]
MHDREREERLNDWLNRHEGLLVKVARSFTRTSHDQDDLIQEISFQLWKSIPGYQPRVAESTWVYRVAFYTAINWSRKERSREERVRELRDKPPPNERSGPPDQRLEWLYDQIARMEPIDRSLTLLVLDGRSYREMSETLGISESNVGVRINRLKKRLTNQLERGDDHEL